MQEINTRRVKRELAVLRLLVSALKALVTECGELGKYATYYPNPGQRVLTAFRADRIPINKISEFLGGLYTQLAANEIGVMLDTVVLKPLVYKSAEDARNMSLKKTLYVNLSLCTWTRENIGRLTVAAAPNDKFYNVDLLVPIIDQLDADIEVVEFERSCVDTDRPSRKRIKAPLLSKETAMKILGDFNMEGIAPSLLPALGIMNKEESGGQD
jgi:hypothetical protein